jgi:putative transposase
VILLSPRRLRRWAGGRDLGVLEADDLTDRPPVARTHPHALTPIEREQVKAAARELDKAHLRHRKLTHTLSRQARVFCSESSTLRILREDGLVPAYRRTRKPKRTKPEVPAGRPNQSWRFDFTDVPTRAGTWHLLPLLDACSRKIVGWSFESRETADMLERTWGKALASEGLLALPPERLPASVSDRGTQMTARTFKQFLADLGIPQILSRPRTPADNAVSEAFNATIKCEELYRLDTRAMSPGQVEAAIAAFITAYNEVRLHQGIGFVTPAERHDGRHEAIIAARLEGMTTARDTRGAYHRNREGDHLMPVANGAQDRSERLVSIRSRRRKVIGPCS